MTTRPEDTLQRQGRVEQHISEYLRTYPTTDPPGLRAVGEVDYATHAVWQAALDAVASAVGNVHLELSELSFIDAQGTSLLVAAALQLGGGRRIVLHHPPRMLPRILELCWPPLSSIKVAAS